MNILKEILIIFLLSSLSRSSASFSSEIKNKTIPRKVTIQKCCSPSQVMVRMEDEYACELKENSSKDWNPTLYSEPEVKSENENISITFVTRIIQKCHYKALANALDLWFNILSDGKPIVGLNFWTIAAWLKPTYPNYCVDSLKHSSPSLNDFNNERNYILLFCELEDFQFYLGFRYTFATLFMISTFCILITIIIYTLIWDQHTIHGYTQFSFLVSFFFYYVAEGSRLYAKANGLNIVPSFTCFVHAIISHYFTIVISGTACMMSLDCFVTFWKLSSAKTRGKKEVILYYALGWGVPLMAFIVGLFLYFRNNPDKVWREVNGVFEYAHYRCSSPIWEEAFRTQLLLLIVNFLAFVGTAFLIGKHFRSVSFANQNNSVAKRRRRLKRNSMLFLKLFIMMGASWSLSAIDILYGYKNPMGWGLIIVRGYLALQGIVFMAIFGINEKNLVLLKKKYPHHQRIWKLMAFFIPKTTGQPATSSSSNNSSQSTKRTLMNSGSITSTKT